MKSSFSIGYILLLRNKYTIDLDEDNETFHLLIFDYVSFYKSCYLYLRCVFVFFFYILNLLYIYDQTEKRVLKNIYGCNQLG